MKKDSNMQSCRLFLGLWCSLAFLIPFVALFEFLSLRETWRLLIMEDADEGRKSLEPIKFADRASRR